MASKGVSADVAEAVAVAAKGLNVSGIETGLLVGAEVGVAVGPVGVLVGGTVGFGVEGARVGDPGRVQVPSSLGICNRADVVPVGTPVT